MRSSDKRNLESNGAEVSGAIKKYLDLSTAHICRDTADWLSVLADDLRANGGDNRIIHDFTHGWFFSVTAFDTHDGTPEDLKVVIGWAREQDCQYVMLDADAEVLPELPTYDW
jgi:hypothetical protein